MYRLIRFVCSIYVFCYGDVHVLLSGGSPGRAPVTLLRNCHHPRGAIGVPLRTGRIFWPF